jgi:vacuolar iron transporter family protein
MSTDDIKRYQVNLRDELDGSALCTSIAVAERDPVRKDLFLQLAQAEARHAALWRDKLAAAGIKEWPYIPSFRTRLLGKLALRFGPAFVMPTIAAAEFSDRNRGENYPSEWALQGWSPEHVRWPYRRPMHSESRPSS